MMAPQLTCCVMTVSKLENLSNSGLAALPECRCGAEMRLLEVKPSDDMEIRIFSCDTCHHKFRLMAWKASDTQDPGYR